MEKYGGRLQGIMITLKYVDLKSLRKRILRYLTLQIPVSLLVCFLRACLLFLFYRVPHCKRIEIRSLCHMHQACFLFAGEGGGTIQRRDGPKVRQGRSRRK